MRISDWSSDVCSSDLKKHPEELNHGVASTSFQLVAETLADKAGIKLTHINYRGSGPTIVALRRGEVQLALLDSAAVVGQIQAGTLKALAVTSAARSKVLPDVPTEIGRASCRERVCQYV